MPLFRRRPGRKSILALLISFLVGAGALGLWLPSLLCGGMSGWQLWAPPLILLLATWSLMRAWTSGRLRERKPRQDHRRRYGRQP